MQHNFRFVLTSRFNQDIVENWFSCVRGKGRNNDSRTTVEYESASKNIAVNWMLEKPCHRGSNCELDYDAFIGLLGKVQLRRTVASHAEAGSVVATNVVDALQQSSLPTAVTTRDTADDDDNDDDCNIDISSDWCQLFDLCDVDKNVACYIAGYLCAKLNRIVLCTACSNAYIFTKNANKSVVEKHTLLIHCRQFDWAKYGLTVPSPAVFDFCCAIERVVQINIEGVIAGLRVMGCLYDIVLQTIDCNSYSIDTCCTEHKCMWVRKAIWLYLRVRIHHFVRTRNTELKQLAEQKKQTKVNKLTAAKPSRKTKKVKHL